MNAPVALAGQVSDFDGDSLTYQWMEGTTESYAGEVQGGPAGDPVNLPLYNISSLPVGDHQIILQVTDGVQCPHIGGNHRHRHR